MANSKLLREAIADAKAVRETAIANAKIALEEAFTPRLQSILSKKLQSEMADDDVDTELDNVDDTELTQGDVTAEGGDAECTDCGDDVNLEEPVTEEDNLDAPVDDTLPTDDIEVAPEDDEDDLDLESIIRELEGEPDTDDTDGTADVAPTDDDEELNINIEDDETPAPTTDDDVELGDQPTTDDDVDLDEILREMGYGDDAPAEETAPVADDNTEELEAALGEAYNTIKSLKRTINEVNLLNAKLLYSNKLFRSYNLTNEQKVKVVENLDRTSNVREVKLVYATLAESMKFTGTERKAKRNISEGFASKPTQSTKPSVTIISESSDAMAMRFKQLAGIIK